MISLNIRVLYCFRATWVSSPRALYRLTLLIATNNIICVFTFANAYSILRRVLECYGFCELPRLLSVFRAIFMVRTMSVAQRTKPTAVRCGANDSWSMAYVSRHNYWPLFAPFRWQGKFPWRDGRSLCFFFHGLFLLITNLYFGVFLQHNVQHQLKIGVFRQNRDFIA